MFAPGAGIIILHPFLVPLFNELGLLEEEQFVNSVARLKAFAVLHYIAFGSERVTGQSGAFLKFLCGIQSIEFIEETAVLTEEETGMIRECLAAFLAHWPALKNVSVDGLRTSFFQREGNFTKEEDRIEVYIAGSSIDILLDQYPWGLSIIKLPWMEPLLYVSIG